MRDTLYYPLLSMDSDGDEKQPMFPTKDERTVRENHGLWLMETLPKYFRLRSSEKVSAKAVAKFRFHCPNCGAVMVQISKGTKDALPLYACPQCENANPRGRGKSL